MKTIKNEQFPASVLFISVFLTVWILKFCWWLDSNCRPLVSEVTNRDANWTTAAKFEKSKSLSMLISFCGQEENNVYNINEYWKMTKLKFVQFILSTVGGSKGEFARIWWLQFCYGSNEITSFSHKFSELVLEARTIWVIVTIWATFWTTRWQKIDQNFGNS